MILISYLVQAETTPQYMKVAARADQEAKKCTIKPTEEEILDKTQMILID
mgnify:CR=1 FL=1